MDVHGGRDLTTHALRPGETVYFFSDRPRGISLEANARRIGKNAALVAIAVNYCLETPGATLSMYTTSKRSSHNFRAAVLDALVRSDPRPNLHCPDEDTIFVWHRDRPKANPAVMRFLPAWSGVRFHGVGSAENEALAAE